MTYEPHIVVVCGLAFEAHIAAGEGVVVVCGGDQRRLIESLRIAVTADTRGIISFGVAAGLVPGARSGTCIVGKGVVALGDGYSTDVEWSHSMLAALPHALHGDIFGSDRPILEPAEKRMLHARTGAVAVDMESHIAGRVARDRQRPFAVLRVVVDPSDRLVPRAALAGQRPDGNTNVRAVFSELLHSPSDLPAMLRLGFDAWMASRALLRCRRKLGQHFAFVDIGEHLLNVP